MVTDNDGVAAAAAPSERVTALVREWVARIAAGESDRRTEHLAALLRAPGGVAFTMRMLDGVLRPENTGVAAANLHRLAAGAPQRLPWTLRSAVAVGGAVAPVLPAPTVPLSKQGLRDLVAGLFLDARGPKLTNTLQRLHEQGYGVDVQVPGERFSGVEAVQHFVANARNLIARDDVQAVTLAVPAALAGSAGWGFADAVDDATERLAPLVRAAISTRTAITVAPQTPRELDVAVATFTRLLEEPGLEDADAGIVLSSSVPDAFSVLAELTAWARQRVEQGLSPIRVRVVKGDQDGEDRVHAALRGWDPATFDTSEDRDAAHLRLIEWATRPEHAAAVRLAVNGDLFDLAFAVALAEDRNVADMVRLELPLGVAPAVAAAVRETAAQLTLSAPVLDMRQPAQTAAVLARRVASLGAPDGVMVATAAWVADAATLAAAEASFAQRLARSVDPELPAATRITQDRSVAPAPAVEGRVLRGPSSGEDALTQEVLGIAAAAASTDTTPMGGEDGLLFGGTPFVETAVFQTREDRGRTMGAAGFRNAPATDPTSVSNRAWAGEIFARVADAPHSSDETGDEARAAAAPDAVEAAATVVRGAASAWQTQSALDRSDVLRHAAVALDTARTALIVAAAGCGALLTDADAQVSEAVDAAAYVASTCRELDAISGARFIPDAVTAVFPHPSAPISGTAEAVTASLAAGSGVLLGVASRALPVARLIVGALEEAGVAQGLVQFVNTDASAVRDALVAVADRVVYSGEREEALRLRATRTDVPLLAQTPGVVTTIVTPAADLDCAVSDLVASAFSRAGTDPAASSVAILVGSVGRSRHVAERLSDAVRSVHAGGPEDPSAVLGPLPALPGHVVEAALRTLEAGEAWLIEPRQRDERLWTPGVRTGVTERSAAAAARANAPVLAVVAVATFGEALRVQEHLGSGYVAALQSLDPAELDAWLAQTQAASLVVNRPTVGARIQAQPRGSWGASDLGGGYACGGPNRLLRLGSWRATAGTASSTLHLRGLDSRVTTLVEAAQPDLDYESFDWVRRAALADAVAWDREYGQIRDVTRLGFQRDLFRYRRVPVAVRATEGATLAQVIRVVLAAVRTGSEITLSRANGIPAGVRRALGEQSVPVFVETDEQWRERVLASPVDRARIFGADAAALARTLAAEAPERAVFSDAVTTAGRLELLPFLREQAISITAHRFGEASDWSAEVI